MNMNEPNRDAVNPDESMDRLFDRELSKEEQDALARDFAHEPEALRRFRDTTNILLALREPVSTPDLTDAVLSRLLVRRRVVRGRRLLSPGRVAVAAALLLAGGGLALLQQPGRSRTAPMASRSAELDPLLARIFDPQLAELELADLKLEASVAQPRVATISQRATLNAPRLVFELSPVQSLAGAGEATTAYAPYQLVLEDEVQNWLAGNGSIVLGPATALEAPRVLGPRMREPDPVPIIIGIQSPEKWLLSLPPAPEAPDRMLLWPEALELRLDLSEARQPAPGTKLNK